jgi:UDP-N-acetylmuramoyl-tripeptide--D-alanyl-D-alanine ligase
LHGHARRVLVLGDMLELGRLAAELHFEIGVEAAKNNVDLLIVVGELTRATAAGALENGMPRERVVHVSDTAEALARVPSLLHDGDVVLVKGSRMTGLDQLVRHLVALEAEAPKLAAAETAA